MPRSHRRHGAVFIFAGCAPVTTPQIEPPQVTLESVRVTRIVDQRAELLVEIKLSNPNASTFGGRRPRLRNHCSTVVRRRAGARVRVETLPAGGEAKVELTGRVDIAAIATAMMALGSQLPVAVHAQGHRDGAERAPICLLAQGRDRGHRSSTRRSARARDDAAAALHQDAGARQRLRRARRRAREDRSRARRQLRRARRPPFRRRLRPDSAGRDAQTRLASTSAIGSSTPTAARSSNAATVRAASCTSSARTASPTRRAIRVETLGGVIEPALGADGQVTVDMGVPRFAPERFPSSAGPAPLSSRSRSTARPS